MQLASTRLDLRELGCQQRHGLVFQALAVLEPDHAITIINDHEPEPLRLQIAARFSDAFAWELEQKGPQEYHATIRRLPERPPSESKAREAET